ncbi:MAG: zinc ribbon domain-containing protein [Gemmatimonadota bacterium]|nr:MAG: zinc ribbon domain-containing protein [Gemmatimonadota bacterium]
MPTYHYICPKCGHDYEKLQKISDDTRAKCPECGTEGERQISGGGGVVFKGSGFYETDYKRAAEKKPAEKPKEEAKSASDEKPKKKDEPKAGADS